MPKKNFSKIFRKNKKNGKKQLFFLRPKICIYIKKHKKFFFLEILGSLEQNPVFRGEPQLFSTKNRVLGSFSTIIQPNTSIKTQT